MYITHLPLIKKSNNYLQPRQLYPTSVLSRILRVTCRHACPPTHPSPSHLTSLALTISMFRIPMTWHGPFHSHSCLLLTVFVYSNTRPPMSSFSVPLSLYFLSTPFPFRSSLYLGECTYALHLPFNLEPTLGKVLEQY